MTSRLPSLRRIGRAPVIPFIPLLIGLAGAQQAPALAGGFDIALQDLQRASPAPGTVLNAGNREQFTTILDPDVADLIDKGWLEIAIGEPLSFDPHPAYAEATQRYSAAVKLGEHPGELSGYVAGRPFPDELSRNDPRAGDKLAWNLRYAYGGDAARVPEMYWYYIDMRGPRLERTLEFVAAQMRFAARHVLSPVPSLKKNPYGVFSALTLEALAPGDVAKTKLLIFRNLDDNKEEQGWMYVPNLRRVRRIATTARTDSFLGSDIMIEDFLGYSGRIRDMEWQFLGTKRLLLPMYRHDQVPHAEKKARRYNYHFVAFHGLGNCFPNVTWQLRDTYVLVGRPKRANHPIGKRFFYIDQQTMFPVLGKVYDRAGVLWKILLAGLAHPDHHLPDNAGSGVPLFDSSTVVDLQNKHCTALQAITRVQVKRMKQREFEPSALYTGAR